MRQNCIQLGLLKAAFGGLLAMAASAAAQAGVQGGQVVQQFCVAPISSMPGRRQVLDVMERLSDQMLEFENGKPTGEEDELKSWRELSILASRFEILAGLRKTDLGR